MSEYLIPTNERWSPNPGIDVLSESEDDKIRALLMGRTVRKVNDDHLLLDDGTLLRVVPNEGGCSCGAGDYYLTDLNDCPNVITKVEVVDEDTGGDAHTYRIFVFAGDKRINLVSIEGDDGSGYYGTGYDLLVRRSETPDVRM